MRSVDAAAQSMAEELFEDVGGGHSGLAQLQEIKTVRLIVFFIGALPQVIKLYAMRGILGTQICASLFFGSFLIIEAITTWLNTYDHRTEGLNGQITALHDSIRILRGTTLSMSYGFPIGLTFIVTGMKYPNDWTLLTFGGLMYGLAAFLSIPFEQIWREAYGRDLKLSEFCMCAILMFILGFVIMLLVQPVIGSFELHGLGILLCFSPWPVIYVPIFFLTDREGEDSTRHQRFGHLVFMLLQITAAVLTYLFRYNPVGTYKPGWTNYLG